MKNLHGCECVINWFIEQSWTITKGEAPPPPPPLKIILDSTNEELLERASIVSASSNVKYCYEQEITQGGISQEYTTLRDDALKKLEDSCKFFIFSGDR